eukprot:SAG22_NODE_2689_length_2310_cov_1.448666_3_plen_321_part_01
MRSILLDKASIWEGGYREPGIAWWPGKIKAGSSTAAVAATYDIFPTVLALAGVAPPAGVILDGIDLADVLFSPAPEQITPTSSSVSSSAGGRSGGHECIMFYKSPQAAKGAEGAADLTSLAAVRCGNYKVYWLIDGESTTPLPAGVTPGVRTLDTPVIFDVEHDWSEGACSCRPASQPASPHVTEIYCWLTAAEHLSDKPLAQGSAEWLKAKAAADAARAAHLKTLFPVVDQMARGHDHAYAICSDPASETKVSCKALPFCCAPTVFLAKTVPFGAVRLALKYPGRPNCTMSPDNWAPPICLVGGSRGACISQTSCTSGCK